MLPVLVPEADRAPLGYLYRFEDAAWSSYDPERDEFVGSPRVTLGCYSYDILRETPKGVRILYQGRERTVLDESRKKFACRTQALALQSFIARKQAQIRILEASLRCVREAEALAREALTKEIEHAN